MKFPRRRSRIAESKHGFMSKPRDWLLRIGYAVTFNVGVLDGLLQLAHEVTLLSSIPDMPSSDLGRTPTVLIRRGKGLDFLGPSRQMLERYLERVRSQPLSSFFVIFQLLDAVQCTILTASLNNL